MRNATINHRTACTHAQTPAARKACRKAARTAAPVAPKLFPVAVIGRSNVGHLAVMHDGKAIAVDCGAGLGRGVRRNSPVYFQGMEAAEGITCTKCTKAAAKLV